MVGLNCGNCETFLLFGWFSPKKTFICSLISLLRKLSINVDFVPYFKHTKKEKRNAKKNYKMLKIKARKALAKKEPKYKTNYEKRF